jgi:hypothetical protein
MSPFASSLTHVQFAGKQVSFDGLIFIYLASPISKWDTNEMKYWLSRKHIVWELKRV